jgi:hypothetical protein
MEVSQVIYSLLYYLEVGKVLVDANGCGSTIPIVIQLINSPKYFTNGDGFNDGM